MPASAHPTLLTTTPEAGYSVESAPDQVTLVFDEPVSVLEPHGVRVEDADHEPIRSSQVIQEQAGLRLVVRLLEDLPLGRYVVRWRVTAQDGDVVDAGFDFAVATATGETRGREAPTSSSIPARRGLAMAVLPQPGQCARRPGRWLIVRRTVPPVGNIGTKTYCRGRCWRWGLAGLGGAVGCWRTFRFRCAPIGVVVGAGQTLVGGRRLSGHAGGVRD